MRQFDLQNLHKKSHSTRNPSISMGRCGQKPLGQLTLKHIVEETRGTLPQTYQKERILLEF